MISKEKKHILTRLLRAISNTFLGNEKPTTTVIATTTPTPFIATTTTTAGKFWYSLLLWL